MSTPSYLYLLWMLFSSCAASPKQVAVLGLDCHEYVCEGLTYPKESEVAFFTEESTNLINNYASLVLRNSHLYQLPLNVFKTLVKLEIFDVQGCQVQHVASECFEGAVKLKTLQLAGNLLKQLESETFTLASELEELNLADNRLEQLPAKVFAGLRQLRQLSLQGNRLMQLPANVFNQLPQLEELNLDDNQLSELPSELCADQLQLRQFSARGNRLKQIASSAFPAVQRLIVSENPQLRRLHLTGRILELQADNCQLQNLRLDQAEHLEQLLLGNTQLKSLDFLRNANNLVDLDLTGLQRLPVMPNPWPAQRLERLSISYANATDWPDQMLAQLPALKVLDIWHQGQREIYIKGDFNQLNNHYIDETDSICAQLESFLGDTALPKHITIFDNNADAKETYSRQCPGVELAQAEELLFFEDDFDSLT